MQAYQLSYWEKSVFFDQVDVAIIGSGIVGLSAAITLKERKPDWTIAVLERGPLPIGASTRNAGFACFGSVTELLSDLKTNGEDNVWKLVEKRWKGLKRLRQRVGDQALDYKAYGGYELFRPEDKALFEECMDHVPQFNKALKSILGETEYFTETNDQIGAFGFKNVDHLLLNKAEGQINTGRMMQALLEIAKEKGIDIYNGIEIEQLEDQGDRVVVETKLGWSLKAQKVLVATNGFAKHLLPNLTVKPARNQVLITKAIPQLKIKGCFHYDQGYYYFRNIDQRLLLGGGRNLALDTEYTDSFGTTEKIQSALVQMLKDVILPGTEFEIDTWWSGILGVGTEKMPIIEKTSANVVVAVRLGGMGVALGSLVGEEGAELLIGV
jgi:hypothetical protein